MVIRALDHVKQCNTAEDGKIINDILRPMLRKRKHVTLSFDGVSDVPSSFVNASIVTLLEEFDDDFVKSHLRLIDATKQIADMVRRCLANGIRRFKQ